jgi:hypothetical protein
VYVYAALPEPGQSLFDVTGHVPMARIPAELARILLEAGLLPDASLE